MTIIKLKRYWKENPFHYTIEGFLPKGAIWLALFLTDDVGRRINGWVGDFESVDDHAGSGNATQYIKEDGMVTFTPEWVWDDDESMAKGDYFQIPALLLVDLLYQWEILLKNPTDYAVITIEGDVVKVVGSNEDIPVDAALLGKVEKRGSGWD